MSQFIKCDGGGDCLNTTNPDDPRWIKVTPPPLQSIGHGDAEMHFCSWECVKRRAAMKAQGFHG